VDQGCEDGGEILNAVYITTRDSGESLDRLAG
jgi:hypothetical protein